MNLTLCRTDAREDGIFGILKDELGQAIGVTLEHAYPDAGRFAPKIPSGVFTCQRGCHQLQGGVPFETFEVTGIDGHSGILFHAGNFNRDSEGCILVGRRVSKGLTWTITDSRSSFAELLDLQSGVDSFELTVV